MVKSPKAQLRIKKLKYTWIANIATHSTPAQKLDDPIIKNKIKRILNGNKPYLSLSNHTQQWFPPLTDTSSTRLAPKFWTQSSLKMTR